MFAAGTGEVGGEGTPVRPIASGRLTPCSAQQQPEPQSELPALEARGGCGGRGETDIGEEPMAFVMIEIEDGGNRDGHGG